MFKVKAEKTNKILFIFIDTGFRFFFYIFIKAPYFRAFNMFISIILLKILFRQNIEKCILSKVINSISTISIEVVFSKILCTIIPNTETYLDGLYNYSYSLCILSIIFIFRIIICYFIKKRNIAMNINDHLSRSNRNSIIFTSIIGCMLIFFNAIEMTIYISDFPYSIFLLDIVPLIGFFVASMKNIMRINKLEEQDLKIHSLEAYNNTLSIMYDSIRGFRHDFSNFVQALYGYASAENIEGIKKMSESILADCKNINNMGILDPKIINNPAVYSIITSKYYTAIKENITMNIEFMIDLNEVNINTYELCRILGILLDNAIEAAKQCGEKVINVRFLKDYKANRKLIIVENSYNRKNIDIDRIFEKGCTTKSDENKEHGLGLWTVRNILEHSNNLNLFTTTEDLFCQQLEIYE